MSDSETRYGFGELQHGQDDMSLMSFIVRQIMNSMATTSLVQVKAVNAETVDVQPMVHQIDGKGTAIPHSIIHALPYFKLRAGGSAVRLTPKVGDIGVAVFTSSDSSSVKKNKAPANPGSRRRFDWADGLYFGGFLGVAETTFVDLDDDVGVTVTVPSGKTVIMTAGSVNMKISASGVDFSGGTVKHNGVNIGSTHHHAGVQTGTGTSDVPS